MTDTELAVQRIVGRLEEVRRLLLAHDLFDEAGVVDDLLLKQDVDREGFFEELSWGGALWGGAGALWEVLFDEPPTRRERAKWKQDQRRFQQLLVEIVDDSKG